MVIDVGGGTTNVAVLSMNGVAVSSSIQVAGDTFDDAIIRHVRRKHKIVIGQTTAEDVKIQIGCVYPRETDAAMLVKGRDAKTGMPREITLLFTHDLHSHLLPSRAEDGGEYGGYARLMTVIRKQKELYPDAILVDAGDFSMGSLFQTAYATSALELRIMGAMGYDATTFGNHEFDYLPQGLASMLNVAAGSGEQVPAIVDANYLPPMEGAEGYGVDAEAVWAAMDNYGVQDYILLERGGIFSCL